MSHRSIRFRLTIWYSLALAAGLILLALATWGSMRQMLLLDIDRSLSGRITSSRTFVESELREKNVHLPEELGEYATAFSPGSYLRVTNSLQQVVFDSSQSFPWPGGSSRVVWNGQPYLVLVSQQTVDGQPWLFAASTSLSETNTLLARLRLLLVMLIPMVIGVASVGGRWLSRRALAPVDEMTAAAKSISASNLSDRLSVPRTGDELERLADTWNSMLARLEETLKRLSRFTADASHELRTPLAIIRTTAELTTRRARTADVYRDALQQIAGESERMTKLLEDLLLMARIDAEPVQMPQSTFDLVPVVDAICSQIKPLSDAKGLQVRFHCPEETAPVIGNEAAIRRLILALLDNAVKYSPEGAAINVMLNNRKSEICLDVVDSGPGIAQQELPRIFERFYRGPYARSGAREGTGLGLSLAAGLAEKNHAQIKVSSEPGKGSTFRVLFRPAA